MPMILIYLLLYLANFIFRIHLARMRSEGPGHCFVMYLWLTLKNFLIRIVGVWTYQWFMLEASELFDNFSKLVSFGWSYSNARTELNFLLYSLASEPCYGNCVDQHHIISRMVEANYSSKPFDFHWVVKFFPLYFFQRKLNRKLRHYLSNGYLFPEKTKAYLIIHMRHYSIITACSFFLQVTGIAVPA